MSQHDKSRIENMIRCLASARSMKLSVHAHAEMIEEDITVAELRNFLMSCTLHENYPDHK